MPATPSRWRFVAFFPRFPPLETVVGGDQIRPFELFTEVAGSLGQRVRIYTPHESGRGTVIRSSGLLEHRSLGPRARGASGTARMLRRMRRALRFEVESARRTAERPCFYQQVPSGTVMKAGVLPLPTKPSVALLPIARELGATTWAAMHDISPEHGSTARRRTGRSLAETWVPERLGMMQQRLLLPVADFVTTVSGPMRDLISARCSLDPSRVAVFHSAINPRILEGMTRWTPPRDGARWTVGYVGSMHDVSLNLILATLAEVPEAIRPRLRIYGVGAGEAARELSSRGVELEVGGESRYADLGRVASDVDLWLLPYDDAYYETITWELKAPMYLATGRPVIRTGGEALERSGLAEHFFVTGNTPTDVARTVSEVVQDGPGARARADNARAAVLAHETWKARAHELLESLTNAAR